MSVFLFVYQSYEYYFYRFNVCWSSHIACPVCHVTLCVYVCLRVQRTALWSRRCSQPHCFSIFSHLYLSMLIKLILVTEYEIYQSPCWFYSLFMASVRPLWPDGTHSVKLVLRFPSLSNCPLWTSKRVIRTVYLSICFYIVRWPFIFMDWCTESHCLPRILGRFCCMCHRGRFLLDSICQYHRSLASRLRDNILHMSIDSCVCHYYGVYVYYIFSLKKCSSLFCRIEYVYDNLSLLQLLIWRQIWVFCCTM